MNKIYTVAGAACTGVFTGWPATGHSSWCCALGVVPRVTTVPACLFLQTAAPAILAPLSAEDSPEPSMVTLGLLGLGPALVALCTIPAWRRAGQVGVGTLLLSFLLLHHWTVG
ncbi:hypothetical protein ACWGAN_35505 [Streptomyces sp. NPDC054945]